MKHFILTTITVISASSVFAQWNQSTTAGASYHTGSVSIGFDPPSYPLHILTGSNMDRSIGFTDANDFLSSRSSMFYTTSGGGSGIFQYAGHLVIQPRTNVPRNIYFNTYDGTSVGTRFAILGNGNVGVGTVTPAANLDIVANGARATLRIKGTASSPSWQSRLLLDRTENYRGSGVWIQASEGTETDWYAGVPYTGNGFTIGNHATQPEYKENSILFLKPSGQIGIGTSTPAGNLEIFTNTTGGDQLHISNVNTAGRTAVTLKEGTTTKAFFQYRGTTSTSFANSLRLMTQSGTNADIYIGASGGHHLFIAGGQNGVVNGYIGIGTTTPDAKLTVKGRIHAEEVKIDLSVPAPDYVFEKNYPLLSLDEVKTYIDEHKHLPEVPSAKEMEEHGVDLGEMNMILLRKVEELTLYTIKLKEENNALQERSKKLETIMGMYEDRQNDRAGTNALNSALLLKLEQFDTALKEQQRKTDALEKLINEKN